MKHFLRFILLSAFLGICLYFGYNIYEDSGTDLKGSSSKALLRYYDAVRASDINEKKIGLILDEQKGPVAAEDLLMSDTLELMMPADEINDLFNCSVAYLTDGSIRITGENDGCILSPLSAEGAEDPESTGICMTGDDGQLMVSVAWLADFFDYTYEWSDDDNTAFLKSPKRVVAPLPESYDLRTVDKVSPVRNQGSWGTCWAFSALSAMESVLLPDEEWQFSTDHLVHHHGFEVDINDGGDYNMALAYLASWRGPVTEEEDPYDDGSSPDDISCAVHLQDAIILRERDETQIKRLIYTYGAVQSAIYSRPDFQEISRYYNAETAAYYYPLKQECNHDITIIGWDDHYPKENFTGRPEHDGAYICKNSWGSSFGKDGYFYISYDDPNIGIYGVAYTGIEPADNYDQILQSDLLGWTGSIGYNDPEAWFANVFTAEGDARICAASFYATDPDSWYDIYLVRNYKDASSLSSRQLIRSGYLPDKGYFTIPFDQPAALDAGESFAVIVHIRTKDSVHPVAIEYPANEVTRNADLTDGEGYMSFNGSVWTSMEQEAQCNACLKAFLNSR